jgi:hypothetical protein
MEKSAVVRKLIHQPIYVVASSSRALRVRIDLCSAAVISSFLNGLPGNRCKSALEKGIVYDVLLVIFAFDNPVTGTNLTLS